MTAQADTDRSGRSEPAGRLALLIASVLVGIGLAHASMPALFRTIPTDLSRIPILLETLRDGETPPQIAILGDSVAMCAIDGMQLSEELPSNPVAYNLASTGQTLVESYLMFDSLPDGLDTVVAVVSASNLLSGRTLAPQKYNAFFMGGYRPSLETRRSLAGIFGSAMAELLDLPEIVQRFRSRWVVRQAIDHGLRRALRPDLQIDRAISDLYFPQPYTRRFDDAKMQRAVSMRIDALVNGSSEIDERKARLLTEMARVARERGARLAVVLPPVHPGVRLAIDEPVPESARRLLRELSEQQGILIVDLGDLLPEEEFVDHVHPTGSGAQKVTRRVAQALENGT